MNHAHTALHTASRDGCLQTVISLVKEGADIEARTAQGDTPLFLAAGKEHEDIIEFLINAGANLNQSNSKWSLLHSASYKGWLKIVQSLVNKGLSIDAKTEYDSTPLLKAAYAKHKDVVQLLINAGANLNLYDVTGWTVLHYVTRNGWLDIVQSLLEKGVIIDTKDEWGSTPLLTAADLKHKDIVELLIRAGANFNRYGKKKWTVLHYASRNGWLDIVQYLLKKKVDINARTANDSTCLHIACIYKNIEIVKYLINAGADVNVVSSDGKSPLSESLQTFNIKLVRLLIESGAYLKLIDFESQENSLLKDEEHILKDVNLCSQAIVNEFNHKDLPALYKLCFTNLPCINKITIVNNSHVANEVIQSVEHEIKAKGHCDLKSARPIILKILAVKSFLSYYDKKQMMLQIKHKRSAENGSGPSKVMCCN